MGWQFGPVAAILATSAEDALDEFDEHYGERVEPTDSALLDYDGPSLWVRVCAAMDAGDVRINSGGTTVWVDPYETMRELRAPLRNMRPEIRKLL